MSASNFLENQFLLHLLQNANIANIGDVTGLRGSTTAGSVFVSLHTADPGEAGTQATSETTYTGYARIGVVRSAVGWTVATNTYTNAAAINFGSCTVGTPVITHFGIGAAVSGATDLYLSGPLGASLAVSPGIAPSFAAGAITGSVD